MFRRFSLIAIVAAAAVLAGCTKDDGTYLKVVGGGFIFNYRIAVATAGVLIVPMKPLPEGAIIEVTMDNPAGGLPIAMHENPSSGSERMEYETDPLQGIKAKTDYEVKVRLVTADGKELQLLSKTLQSELDQSMLPEKPLTIGPGYQKNPALEEAPSQP